jgi:hypothetical protein
VGAREPAGRIHGYCALCVSRCGSIAVVDNGRFVVRSPILRTPPGRPFAVDSHVPGRAGLTLSSGGHLLEVWRPAWIRERLSGAR